MNIVFNRRFAASNSLKPYLTSAIHQLNQYGFPIKQITMDGTNPIGGYFKTNNDYSFFSRINFFDQPFFIATQVLFTICFILSILTLIVVIIATVMLFSGYLTAGLSLVSGIMSVVTCKLELLKNYTIY